MVFLADPLLTGRALGPGLREATGMDFQNTRRSDTARSGRAVVALEPGFGFQGQVWAVSWPRPVPPLPALGASSLCARGLCTDPKAVALSTQPGHL